MYIKYYKGDDTSITASALRTLSNLSFSPSVDITFMTLPVDTFSADFIGDSDFRGDEDLKYGDIVYLYDENFEDEYHVDGTLYARFYVKTLRHLSGRKYHIEAMSPLGFMDNWTVGAARIDTTVAAELEDLFSGVGLKSGVYTYIAHNTPLPTTRIDGFAPEQTARERLLWICMCGGCYIKQSFCEGLVIGRITRLNKNDYQSSNNIIPIEDTYFRPTVVEDQHVYSAVMEFTKSMSTTKSDSRDHSGVAEDGTTWYWSTKDIERTTNPDEINRGKTIEVRGISLANRLAVDDWKIIVSYIMLDKKIQADIINNGQIKPWDFVMIYTDEETIYWGVITQCVFSFGLQAKARITIATSMDKCSIFTAQFDYYYRVLGDGDTYLTQKIGRKVLAYPRGGSSTKLRVYHPDVILDVAGELITLSPETEYTEFSRMTNRNYTINYERGQSDAQGDNN